MSEKDDEFHGFRFRGSGDKQRASLINRISEYLDKEQDQGKILDSAF